MFDVIDFCFYYMLNLTSTAAWFVSAKAVNASTTSDILEEFMSLLLVDSIFKTAIVSLTEAVVAFETFICKQTKGTFSWIVQFCCSWTVYYSICTLRKKAPLISNI